MISLSISSVFIMSTFCFLSRRVTPRIFLKTDISNTFIFRCVLLSVQRRRQSLASRGGAKRVLGAHGKCRARGAEGVEFEAPRIETPKASRGWEMGTSPEQIEVMKLEGYSGAC